MVMLTLCFSKALAVFHLSIKWHYRFFFLAEKLIVASAMNTEAFGEQFYLASMCEIQSMGR